MTSFSNFSEWSASDKNNFKDWLSNLLKAGPVKIKFRKKDSTIREMSCTLKPDLLIEYEKKTEKTKTASEDVCSVFDLDKNSWRSFRYDSIMEIGVTIE